MIPAAILACANLAVPAPVMHHVAMVESSGNPYAIGVVGARLLRQPETLAEAIATAEALAAQGYNFSVGVAQVNRGNFAKYGLDSYQKAFSTCDNLQAGSRILADCHARMHGAWGEALSCYYSGDARTGFRDGYVQKVLASLGAVARSEPIPARTGTVPVIPARPGPGTAAQTTAGIEARGAAFRRMASRVVPTGAGERSEDRLERTQPDPGLRPASRTAVPADMETLAPGPQTTVPTAEGAGVPGAGSTRSIRTTLRPTPSIPVSRSASGVASAVALDAASPGTARQPQVFVPQVSTVAGGKGGNDDGVKEGGGDPQVRTLTPRAPEPDSAFVF